MKTSKVGFYLIGLQGAVLIGGLFAAAATTALDDKHKRAPDQTPTRLVHSLKGVDIYRAHCASCHGLDGTGNGPVAPALSTKMPDLTTMTQRSRGVFPLKRITKIVMGDQADILAHGSREMPIWGPIFHQVDEDRDYGEVRLHNVVEYLKSLQK
ncbi:MAG: cytochrome c [Acidobacteriia bacterium]|nr:cytochrome c [Terriglobia bacterium]